MFITLEGPEGAGKSSQIRRLGSYFQSLGIEVCTTREPGGSSFGPQVREILLKSAAMEPLSELFLFLADRASHVQEVIRPALAAGKIVLCDRFSDSTTVYQGYARGGDLFWLRDLNYRATGGLVPSLTILLDLPVEVGLARIHNHDRLDAEPLEFHQKVREGFLAESMRESKRFRVVSAVPSEEEVFQAIVSELRTFGAFDPSPSEVS